jgi:hypothetical protein
MPVGKQPVPAKFEQFTLTNSEVPGEAEQHLLMARKMGKHHPVNLLLNKTFSNIVFFQLSVFGKWICDTSCSTPQLKDRRKFANSRLTVAGLAPADKRLSMYLLISVSLTLNASRLPKKGMRCLFIFFSWSRIFFASRSIPHVCQVELEEIATRHLYTGVLLAIKLLSPPG